jgi:transcription termination factor NusB
VNTRAMAAAILLRIRDHGAYSNVILPRATRELSDRDRSFVYRLVTDALRQQRTADALIAAATNRPVSELDPEVSAVLEVAVAELLGDDPDAVYATVNESVEAVRDLGFGRATGLVNGVLRRMTRDGLPAASCRPSARLLGTGMGARADHSGSRAHPGRRAVCRDCGHRHRVSGSELCGELSRRKGQLRSTRSKARTVSIERRSHRKI